MSSNCRAETSAPSGSELHLVCGSGGSRAVLGSAGTILACHLSGIKSWQTVGGASGGSVSTALLASGMPPGKVARLLVELDFRSLLTRQSSLVRMLLTFLLQDRYRNLRPRKAIFSSEKAGQFIDAHVTSWPSNYWTVAAVQDEQWLFTARGVFAYHPKGWCRHISDKPAPVGLAVRASCAVPGVIAPVAYNGQLLFDGALTIDGRCPIGAIKRHFKVMPDKIIACDVGEYNNASENAARKVWRSICGANCLSADGENPRDADGIVLLKPAVNHFPSLKFSLNRDQKWQAVMSGFLGALPSLAKAGLLADDALEQALSIRRNADLIQLQCTHNASEGKFAAMTEELLTSRGLI